MSLRWVFVNPSTPPRLGKKLHKPSFAHFSCPSGEDAVSPLGTLAKGIDPRCGLESLFSVT